jgi:transposase
MKPLVSDELWEHMEPLLPPPPKRRFPSCKPIDYRKMLTGILFVFKTGISWEDLPADLGCGCGKTCRHYLRLWTKIDVWRQLHAVLLAELNGSDKINWERALIEPPSSKPRKEAKTLGQIPQIGANPAANTM